LAYDAAAKCPAAAEINARYALSVRSRHSVRGEALLEAGTYLSSVEPAQIAHGPNSLFLVLYDEAVTLSSTTSGTEPER
jgi:hypothetical protein